MAKENLLCKSSLIDTLGMNVQFTSWIL